MEWAYKRAEAAVHNPNAMKPRRAKHVAETNECYAGADAAPRDSLRKVRRELCDIKGELFRTVPKCG